MKRPPLSSLLSLIVFHAVATCAVDAAPSTEELLAAVPPAIIGPYNGVPRDFTRWHLSSLSGVGSERMSVSFRAIFAPATTSPPNDFLLTEGFLIFDANTSLFSLTAKAVETTRPDDLPGGTWSFSYFRRETNPNVPTDDRVAYWTWTQDLTPTPTQPIATDTGAKVRMSLDLNRAVARSLRGKESRKVLSLLKRQQNLLDEALAATQ
jgi:hypothetical protein